MVARLADAVEAGPKLSYTIRQAVQATGIGRTSLYDDIMSGVLPAHKRGKSTIIMTADLTAYLAGLPTLKQKPLRP
jgi:hypothetical protein